MSDLEIVPKDMNPMDWRQEVNYRTHRAGYTTRNGGPIPRKIQTTVSWGPEKLNVWPRDAAGNLID